jgi:hypothetical protein
MRLLGGHGIFRRRRGVDAQDQPIWEAQIDDLKYLKAAMDLSEYRQKLQGFLVELAKTQAELDK